jgi:hypothetical protein
MGVVKLQFAAIGLFENIPEQLLARGALHEDLMMKGSFVVEAGGYRDPFDAEALDKIEKLDSAACGHPFVEGGVDRHTESLFARSPHGIDGMIKHALPPCHGIMPFPIAVKVDGEGEIRRRGVIIHILFEKQTVRAQIDESPTPDESLNDLGQFLVQEGFPSSYGDHRAAALLRCGKTFGNRQSSVKDFIGISDFAAPRAVQVALEQGFQHENERIPSPAAQLLSQDVSRNAILLNQGDTHFPLFKAPMQAFGRNQALVDPRTGSAVCGESALGIDSFLLRSRPRSVILLRSKPRSVCCRQQRDAI